MNKTEMADALASKTGLSKTQAVATIAAIFGDDGLIASTLKGGGEINLQGFGTLKVTTRAARVATNPANGQKINVPEKKAVKFKPGKNLNQAVA